jgi:predicted nucleic acid-binding protein
MKLLVDTNVFIASLTDEPERGEAATRLLNCNADLCTSILNLMEVRSVLTKKKARRAGASRKRVIRHLYRDRHLCARNQRPKSRRTNDSGKTLLYTLDCVLLALADDVDATMVSFDRELLDNGAVSPSAALD